MTASLWCTDVSTVVWGRVACAVNGYNVYPLPHTHHTKVYYFDAGGIMHSVQRMTVGSHQAVKLLVFSEQACVRSGVDQLHHWTQLCQFYWSQCNIISYDFLLLNCLGEKEFQDLCSVHTLHAGELKFWCRCFTFRLFSHSSLSLASPYRPVCCRTTSLNLLLYTFLGNCQWERINWLRCSLESFLLGTL